MDRCEQNLEQRSFLGKTITINRLIKGLLYLYIVWVAIFGVLNISISGIPAFTLFVLLLTCIVMIKMLLNRNMNNVGLWSVTLCTVMAIVISVMKGWPFTSSVYNAFVYALPLFFLYLPLVIRLDINKICKCIQMMVFVAGVISILIYTGMIDSGLRLRLSITKVDNTIGLLGIVTAFYLIMQGTNMFSAVITLVMAFFVVLTGQSRVRVALSIMVVFLYIIYMIAMKRKGKTKSIVLLVLLGSAATYIAYAQAETFMEYLGFVMDKFSTVGEDASSMYRVKEIGIHIRLLLENPLFGIGCGALNNIYPMKIGNYFYGHSMFTAAFAMNGFAYGFVWVAIIINLVVKLVRNYTQDKNNENFFALILCLLVVVLSFTSAGFSKHSTHIMMLCIGVVLQQSKGIKPRRKL